MCSQNLDLFTEETIYLSKSDIKKDDGNFWYWVFRKHVYYSQYIYMFSLYMCLFQQLIMELARINFHRACFFLCVKDISLYLVWWLSSTINILLTFSAVFEYSLLIPHVRYHNRLSIPGHLLSLSVKVQACHSDINLAIGITISSLLRNKIFTLSTYLLQCSTSPVCEVLHPVVWIIWQYLSYRWVIPSDVVPTYSINIYSCKNKKKQKKNKKNTKMFII